MPRKALVLVKTFEQFTRLHLQCLWLANYCFAHNSSRTFRCCYDSAMRNLRCDSKDTRAALDRKSTRLNSSHGYISYAVFCLKKKNKLLHGRHLLPAALPHRSPALTPPHAYGAAGGAFARAAATLVCIALCARWGRELLLQPS